MVPYNKTEFKVKALTKGTAFDDVYVLILIDKSNRTIFPLPVNANQKEILCQVLNNVESSYSLLESFRSITAASGLIFEGICISNVHSGTYYSDIYLNQNGEDIICEINAGDAIILALYYRTPIFVSESLFGESLVTNDGKSFSFSLKSLSKTLLEKALDDAVEREQYEVASLLRDELKKRS